MKIQKWFIVLAQVICFTLAGGAAWAAGPQKIIVFAAASTTNAVTEIAALFEAENGAKVSLSFASSSTLAKQIEQGAPADVYLSANPKWMNYLEKQGMIFTDSRKDLLGNRIVLIAPGASPMENLAVDKNMDLGALLGDGRLAMGDPDHVPAGMYGKKAMENLGLWKAVEKKIARAKDVRAALVLVEREEAPLGQVYATDAAISKKVKIAGVFPESCHPKIVYPVAMVKKSDTAAAFLGFLGASKAGQVFEKYGFSLR